MATGLMRSQAGVQQHLSDYRVVLLGHRGCGKTSVGNSILGSDSAGPGPSLQSIQRQGEVAQRHITVVEAPGWWKNYLIKDTPELTRQEMELSVTLCPPGPHAFLLVLRLDSSFTEKHRRAVEEHLEILGERVWHHTIVLFTYNDKLEYDIIERRIGSSREAQHQGLVERCRKRYHIFNVDKKGDGPQVMELLGKIDEVIAGNNGCHYESEQKRWRELAKGRTIKAVRAKERMAGPEQCEKVRPGQRTPLSKLRILLLGYRRAGKSSAGNTIIGRSCFEPRRTTQCAQRQAELGQRQITVVDTPGWWKGVSVVDTPELTKQEVVLGASLCPPGPHALLLVHRVDFSFGEDDLRATEEHMALLGEEAWAYTMVLFTHGDWLGGVGIAQYIEAEGEALQCLVEKCGGRYHILSNDSRSRGSKVAELMEKIEAMVGEVSCHFELDKKRVKSLKKSKMAVMKRTVRRVKQQQREKLKFFKGGSYQLATLRIVLLGYIQSGKTSAGNTILGPETFDCRHTVLCAWRHGEVAGQQLTVVDTPGWRKSTPAAATPALTKQEMVIGISLCAPGPHVLLLVVRADASFRADERRAVLEHLELLGEQVWRHILVLFTCGDWLGDRCVEQHIESEGQALQQLLEKCGNRYHVFSSKTKRAGTQVAELLRKVKEMVLINAGSHFEAGNLQLEGRVDGRGVDADPYGARRKETPEGNWMRLDMSDEPKFLAGGKIHSFTRSTTSWTYKEEDIKPAETSWLLDCQEMSEEDKSDDVFLEGSPPQTDVPFFPLCGSLTPIPSAEHSLASSTTSMTELMKDLGSGGIKFPKFLHLKSDHKKMYE